MKCPMCGSENIYSHLDENDKQIEVNFKYTKDNNGHSLIANNKLKMNIYICKDCDYIIFRKLNLKIRYYQSSLL